MYFENMTTFTSINNEQLTQKCRIVLEDISYKLPSPSLENNNVTVPTPTVNGRITSRRQSTRLLQRIRPYMKVPPFRFWKKRRNISKKIRNDQLTDAQHSPDKLTDAKQPNDKSFDTTNLDDQLTAELTALSNLDVNNLIGEMKSFIENGEFESFIENGDFDDELFSSLDATDSSNLNCSPFNSESLSTQPELSTQTKSTHFIPPMASVNETFSVDEIGDLPFDLSINEVKPTDPEWKPSDEPLDLSINKIKSTGQEWKANIITANAQQIESTSQKSSPNFCAYRNDFIESENPSMIPHASVNTLSACCSSNELVNSNTDIASKLNKDLSLPSNPKIVDSTQENTSVTHSAIKSKKTKMNGQPKQNKSCQIFIQNYDVKDCSINRKIFNLRIPKLKKLATQENTSKVFRRQTISQNFSKIHSKNRGQLNLTLSQDDSRTISDISKKISTQPQYSTSPNSLTTPSKSFTLNQRGLPIQRENSLQLLHTPAAKGLLKSENSFGAMQKMVLRLMDEPCFKFLRNEDCGPYCRYNHLLPSTATVAATMTNWPNELIHHFYLTCVQQHMCFIKYFSVVCNMFAERHMINSLLATVKDCERLSNEHYFKSIVMALLQCGMSPDQSIFLLCTNSNRSLASIQVILEIMCSFDLSNFAQTAGFISNQIENYEINPVLAIKILEKAYSDSPLNTVMRNFFITILRKSLENQIFNQKVMEFFLMKILT